MEGWFRAFRTAVLVAILAAAGRASDWYVDAVSGSNANNGTSPALAWRTITHAVASTPQTGAQTIHVAAGTYDAALGEVFPWAWRPSLSLVGQGSALTHVFGTSGQDVMTMYSLFTAVAWTAPTNTLLQGLHFQGGFRLIQGYGNWGTLDPTLRDVRIDAMIVVGLEFKTSSVMGGAYANPLLENVTISGCGTGITLNSFSLGTFNFTARDCSITGSAGEGVSTFSTEAALNATLERCRIEHSGSWGLRCAGNNYGSVHVTMKASTIAHNTNGIWASTSPQFFQASVNATQCTIADNGGIGVRMDSGSPSNTVAHLDSTIVHGHQDDLQLFVGPSASSVVYCEIGDGELAGTQGNFQGDPLFVNAPADDYHLLAGSSCIDTVNPALPLEGDCSRPDVGAFPFLHPQSLAYCTAKINSCGGLPAMGASGVPSATAANGYVVSTTGAKAGKPGLLLYSLAGRAAGPFSGGVLCVASPVRRSVTVIDSIGTPGSCNGVLAIDMNTFARGSLGGNPDPGLSVAGSRVDCQFWGRDTTAGALLSNAVEYFVCQ